MNTFEVLLGFDMETDVGSWTPFHEGLLHGTPKVLEIFRKHEVTGTFYFVGFSAREVPGSVHQVKEAGHEIGAHSLYHETVGDAIFPIPGVYPLLPHEVKPRLELNTRWVEWSVPLSNWTGNKDRYETLKTELRRSRSGVFSDASTT